MSTNKTWEVFSIHQLNYTIFNMYMKIHVNKLHNSFQINKLPLKIVKPHISCSYFLWVNIQNDQENVKDNSLIEHIQGSTVTTMSHKIILHQSKHKKLECGS